MRKKLFETEEEPQRSDVVLIDNSDFEADKIHEKAANKNNSKFSEVSLNKKREEYEHYKNSLAARLQEQNKEWQNWVEMDFICSFQADAKTNSFNREFLQSS